MTPITPNTVIVAAIAWVLGLLLKRVPQIPNDIIPQLTYYISVISTYALAILTSVETANAAVAAPIPAPAPMDPILGGSVSWVLTTVWDWLGRKIIWETLLKKKSSK